ncbi:MAG: hypothetical protein ACPHID_08520, partial [Thermoplasmatota archaeon]
MRWMFVAAVSVGAFLLLLPFLAEDAEATHVTDFATSVPDDKVGEYNTLTMTFKLPGGDMIVRNNAQISLTFPSGYDISSLGAATCAQADIDGGWLAASTSGQVVTIQRDSTGTDVMIDAPEADPFTCTYPNVRNPTTGGSSGGFGL